MPTVVVIGSINLDRILSVPHLPRPGETVIVSSEGLGPGGKGLNQAIAASRCGAATRMVGAIGNDEYGDQVQTYLENENIDDKDLIRVGDKTGVANVLVEDSGEVIGIVFPNANNCLSPKDILSYVYPPSPLVLLQNEVPEQVNLAALQTAKQAGGYVVLNLAPFRPTHPALLNEVDCLVVNETEFAQLVGKPHVEISHQMAYQILCEDKLDIKAQQIVVTLGSSGVVVKHQGLVDRIDAYSVEVVDTTGAGDCFCGALAAHLCSGADFFSGVKFANAAGALSVTKNGAAVAMPSLGEVSNLLSSRQEE